MGDKMTWRTE